MFSTLPTLCSLLTLWICDALLQVLAILPSYAGKTVLELGAGIGRFTGELAKEAGHVIALDFIDSVIKKVSLVSLCLGK